MEFIHPMEALAFFELVDINRQCRAVFPGACAPGGAFQFDGYIPVHGAVILNHRAVNIRASILHNSLDFARRELDADSKNLSTLEIGVRVIQMRDKAMSPRDEIA